MTEDELADHLLTLLPDDLEIDSTDTIHPAQEDEGSNLLERNLPETIDADNFIDEIIGLTTCARDKTSAGQSTTGGN